MVRPCSSPASEPNRQGAPKTKEHAKSEKLNSKIAVIGIDIGKNSFHIVGQDRRGAPSAAPEVVAWPKWKRGLPTCRRV
jgi:transposase